MKKISDRARAANFWTSFCLSLVLLPVVFGVGCSKMSGTKRLAEGQPLTDSIVNDVIHYYDVGLPKGQFLALTIDQHDVDVIARVYAPNGELIGEFDTPTSGRGIELVRIGAEVPGDYRVELYTLSESAEPGEYTIQMVDFHPLTDRDRKILSAVNLHLEADRLRAKPETRRECLPIYEKALQIWREVGEEKDEANTLRAMGFAYQRLNELENAVNHFQQALTIWERIGDLRSAAFTHVIFGVISRKNGDDKMGLEHDLMAQPLWEQAGDMSEFTQNLVRTGNDHLKLKNNTEALKYFGQALENSRRLSRKSIRAYVLSECGNAQVTVGNRDEAIAFYKQSINIWKTLKQDTVVAGLEEKIAKL